MSVSPGLTTTQASGRSTHCGCGHADHGRLHHLRVRHDRVLQLDRADPLAAGLDRGPWCGRRSGRSRSGRSSPTSPVRSQPSSVNCSAPRVVAVVLARRSTGRAPAARRSPRRPTAAISPVSGSTMRSSDQRRRRPCRRARRRPARRRPARRPSVRASVADRGDRDGLGHAPGLQDRQPDLLAVGLRQRPRHGRAAAEDRAQRGRSRPSSMRQRAQPDRRHARRRR